MIRGTQEDAEEFLGFFLETLSEEISELVKNEEERVKKLSATSSSTTSTSSSSTGGGEKDGKGKKKEEEEDVAAEDGWEEVGSKGRTATTRTVSDSLLSLSPHRTKQLRKIVSMFRLEI